jgi:hypothetical protein
MKYLGLTILSLLWILTTLLLAVSCVGLLVFFIPNEEDDIYWFTYGRKLLDGFAK